MVNPPTFEWPEPGQRLLPEGWREAFDARSTWRDGDWQAYIHAYERASDVLYSRIIETGDRDDSLLWPLLFVHRQAIELGLKHLLLLLGHGIDKVCSRDIQHNLHKLWNLARPEIAKMGPAEALKAPEQLLLDLHDVDPRAVLTRYPQERSGGINRFPPEMVDLDRLHRGLRALSNFIGGCCDVVTEGR